MTWASDWSLHRRLRAALVASAALLLLMSTLTAGLLFQAYRSQQLVVDEYFAIYTLSQELFGEVSEAQTAVRSYALSGEEELLAPWRGLPGPGDRRTEELGELVERFPSVRDELETVQAAYAEWNEGFVEPVVAEVQEGGPEAVESSELIAGQRLFNDLRSEFRSYLAAVLDQREDAVDDLQRAFLAAVLTGATSLLLALLLGAALWLSLRRWITDPLSSIAEQSRAVSTGHLDQHVQVEGPPEVRALAADVEAMRRGLIAQLQVVEQAKAEAEVARARLADQAQELERSNRELEQFAYVASHDLQEPLRKVAAFCQMLERRYKGQLDERADQYIAFAVDGAKRMQLLINDLLAFSRVGRLTGAQEDVPLDSCLGTALRNLEGAIEDTGAVVEAEPLPVVRGERVLLVQLLQNLVGNAIKFRGAEPPRVRISAREISPEDETDACWELAVSDNGIGIEPQYAERIFVIFQRLHAREDYEGTGIGLAMCKKIVEYHGGRIWLDPEPELGGTTFRFTLPGAGGAAGGELVGSAATGGEA